MQQSQELESPTTHGEYEPTVLPVIEVSTGLREIVDEINVDAHYFAQLMAREGMSADDIAGTTLVFGAVAKESSFNDGKIDTSIAGEHETESATVTIHVGTAKMIHDQVIESFKNKNDPIPVEEVEDSIDNIASEKLSGVAVHELSHRADHVLGRHTAMDALDYYISLMPDKLKLSRAQRISKILGGGRKSEAPDPRSILEDPRALEWLKDTVGNNYQHYTNEPWEVRARHLEEQEKERFIAEGRFPVNIKFKRSSS